MKFAFCNELFKNWEIKKMCDFLGNLGYQGLEIAPWVYFSSPKDFSQVDKISAIVHKSGLDIVGLHWLFGEKTSYHVNHPDKDIRKKTSAYFCVLVKLCSDLGGKVMIIGSPNQRKVQEGITYEQAWEYTKGFLQKPLKVAGERGVTLCLEPLSKDQTNFINTTQEAIRFIKEVDNPNLALILDAYSLSKGDENMEDIILNAEGYLKHFHADDANKKGPGAGNTDFMPIGRALNRINFQGYVSVEVHDLNVNPERTASTSIKYMKQCFGL
jgi:sugar phosphate isomerase/epimerase